MQGLHHLRKAQRALRDGMDAREALRAAAIEFWNAVYYAPEWPEALRKGAETVYPHILLQGSIDRTVDALNAEGITEARRRILEFCTMAERTNGEPVPEFRVPPSAT